MTIMGGYYYRSQTFSVGDFSRPHIALETATRAAHILDGGDKNPEQRLSQRASIRPAYNDAGDIIAYTVHSRHWVGTVDDAKPDKVRDGEHRVEELRS